MQCTSFLFANVQRTKFIKANVHRQQQQRRQRRQIVPNERNEMKKRTKKKSNCASKTLSFEAEKCNTHEQSE